MAAEDPIAARRSASPRDRTGTLGASSETEFSQALRGEFRCPGAVSLPAADAYACPSSLLLSVLAVERAQQTCGAKGTVKGTVTPHLTLTAPWAPWNRRNQDLAGSVRRHTAFSRCSWFRPVLSGKQQAFAGSWRPDLACAQWTQPCPLRLFAGDSRVGPQRGAPACLCVPMLGREEIEFADPWFQTWC